MDHPRGQGVRQNLVAGVETLGRHDVQGEFLRRLRPAGEGVFAEVHQLSAREQAMRVDIGRERARLAGRFKQGDARINVRKVGARLGDALFILRDRAYDFRALRRKRGDGAYF